MDLLRESSADKEYSQCRRASHMSRELAESREHRFLSGHHEYRHLHISASTLVVSRGPTLNSRLAQPDGPVQFSKRHRAVSTYAHSFCNYWLRCGDHNGNRALRYQPACGNIRMFVFRVRSVQILCCNCKIS